MLFHLGRVEIEYFQLHCHAFQDFALPALPFDVKPDANVDELAKEKEKLQNDIVMLRAEYDAEVIFKKLLFMSWLV